ncbi:MAG: hypothetical protein P4L84_18305 [Isosphaeraceae bacterium]|nr:hypothetical protein [Isosphaeraceae bacterium]
MRCADVIRELSARTESSQNPALAGHLDQCPRCAAWIERDARLGRLWDLTRPQEPSTEAWDGVWGRVCDALDQAPADVLPMRRPMAASRRVVWIGLGIAQVAAVVLVALYFGGAGRDRERQVARNDQVVAPARDVPGSVKLEKRQVDIDSGELVMIREDKGGVQTIELALNGSLGQVDPAYEALNSLEAIAQ